MLNYQLSHDAEEDIHEIYLYTDMHHSNSQAENYSLKLFKTFDLIAKNPKIGRDCSHILPDCNRFEMEKHSIFYRVKSGKVFIMRILHYKMDVLSILN